MIWSRLFCGLRHYGVLSSGIFLSGLLLTSCASAANRQVSSVIVCTYNTQHECIESQAMFPATTPDIMVNANLENVVEGTVIEVQWVYVNGELGQTVEIADTVFRKGDASITSMYAILRRPDNGWPQGDYQVILTSDESNVDPISQPFSIAAGNSANPRPRVASSPSRTLAQTNSQTSTEAISQTVTSMSQSATLLKNVTLCQLNEQGDCLTSIVILPVTSPGVQVKANVSTAPVGTTVETRWRYVEGQLGSAMDIKTISLTKQDEADTWIRSSLRRPQDGWPIGEYEVALSVVPDDSDVASVVSDGSDITVKRFFVQ